MYIRVPAHLTFRKKLIFQPSFDWSSPFDRSGRKYYRQCASLFILFFIQIIILLSLIIFCICYINFTSNYLYLVYTFYVIIDFRLFVFILYFLCNFGF